MLDPKYAPTLENYPALRTGAYPRFEIINAVLRALGVKFAIVWDTPESRLTPQNCDSKSWKRRSSSHCCVAFSLDCRKVAQGFVGVAAPNGSCAQGVTVALKLSSSRQRLSPDRKACSRLVRTNSFRSGYRRL